MNHASFRRLDRAPLSHQPLALFALLLSLALAACDGAPSSPTDAGDAGAFSPDAATPAIDPTRTIASIDDDEAASLCGDVLAYRRSLADDAAFAHLNCLYVGIFSGDDVADCEAIVASCDTRPQTARCELQEAQTPRAECELSVATLQSCALGAVDLEAERLPIVTCEFVGDAAAVAAIGELPESCHLLRDVCPDVYDAVRY